MPMASDCERVRQVKDAVNDGFDEQVAFTQSLIRLPSQRGQEHSDQDLMADAMRDHGLPVDYQYRGYPVASGVLAGHHLLRKRHQRGRAPPTPGLHRSFVDPQRSYRCGAHRSPRHVDESALRTLDRRRLALWPGRRRHEGRSVRKHFRARRAPQPRLGQGQHRHGEPVAESARASIGRAVVGLIPQ